MSQLHVKAINRIPDCGYSNDKKSHEEKKRLTIFTPRRFLISRDEINDATGPTLNLPQDLLKLIGARARQLV